MLSPHAFTNPQPIFFDDAILASLGLTLEFDRITGLEAPLHAFAGDDKNDEKDEDGDDEEDEDEDDLDEEAEAEEDDTEEDDAEDEGAEEAPESV